MRTKTIVLCRLRFFLLASFTPFSSNISFASKSSRASQSSSYEHMRQHCSKILPNSLAKGDLGSSRGEPLRIRVVHLEKDCVEFQNASLIRTRCLRSDSLRSSRFSCASRRHSYPARRRCSSFRCNSSSRWSRSPSALWFSRARRSSAFLRSGTRS